MLDASSFSKYEFAGPAAEAALDRFLAAKLPGLGRVKLTPMLAPSGRLMGDLTAIRLAAERFLLFGSATCRTGTCAGSAPTCRPAA